MIWHERIETINVSMYMKIIESGEKSMVTSATLIITDHGINSK